MNSITERIRALLDERGIEHTFDDSNDYEIIEWGGPYNLWWQFVYDPYEEEPYGELRLLDAGGSTHLTPEQAIAATVGRSCASCPEMDNPDSYIVHLYRALEVADKGAGTCKLVDNDSGPDMHCTACGGGVDDEYRYFMDSWGYSRCPHCGARIIEEETE